MPPLGASLVIGTRPAGQGLDAIRLREALSLKPGIATNRVAVLHGSDRLLAESRQSLGILLRDAGISAVIGPGFSTWWFWTPFDSLAAMALSTHIAALIGRFVAVAPTVVWRNDHDLHRWAAWIGQERIGTIAIDLGTLRPDRLWHWGMGGLTCLSTELQRHGWSAHLVVNGPSTLKRLCDVRASWSGGLTFASQTPWHLAQGGKRLLDDLEWVHDDAPRNELQLANQRVFDDVASGVIGADTAAELCQVPVPARHIGSGR